MQCDEIREMLSAYMDEALDIRERAEVESHIKTCDSCTQELADLQETVKLLRSMGEIAPPDEFRKYLLKKLKNEPVPELADSKIGKNKLQGFLSGSRKYFAAAVIIIGLGISIGIYSLNQGGLYELSDNNTFQGSTSLSYNEDSGSDTSDQMLKKTEDGYSAAQPEEAPKLKMTLRDAPAGVENNAPEMASRKAANTSGTVGTKQLQASSAAVPSDVGMLKVNQKIIKDASVNLEVSKYAQFEPRLTSLVEQYHGYVESSSEDAGGLVTANLVIRVPVQNFSHLLDKIATLGKVKAKQISGQDVTGEYTDSEARLRNLQRQEQRFLALVDKAQSLGDVLTLESELSRVRGDIEVLQSRLKALDSTTMFSTIRVEAREVPKQIEPPRGILSKAWQNFKNSTVDMINSLGDLIIVIGSLLPWLIAILTITGIGYYLWKKKRP